jgi:hypothetical protein
MVMPLVAEAPRTDTKRNDSAFVVGTWELVSTEELLTDGSTRPYLDVGPRGKGYLIYTADGHMCATGMNPDRVAWKDANKPTEAEKLLAMEGFFGYCGRYEVDTINHKIFHYPDVALDPSFVGSKQTRPYRIDGDKLTFSNKDTTPGVESYIIIWKKTK